MVRKATRKFHRLVRAFRRRDEGHVAVIFGLAVLPLMLGVGAAVDYSRGNQVKSRMHAALDSAVLAAAIDGSSNWQTVAFNAFASNLDPTGRPVDAPDFRLDKGIYYGTAETSVQTAFMSIAGVKTLPVRVTSAATNAQIPLCILGLNSFDSGAFDMNGNAKFNAPECAVQANTRDNKGMTQEGKPTAIARRFGVTGGHTGSNYSTPPKDGAAVVPDPYAKMPFPNFTACDDRERGLVINGGSETLSPGTYCGGIRIKGQAKVNLTPGIYVMVGGSFWVDGGSTVTGKEVMIAFTGRDATLRVWGNSTINLTSPTSGTYANFQFFQDPNDQNGRGAWVSLGGNGNSDDSSKATWDGIAYFPTQNFWVYGNTVVNMNSPSLVLVAGQIWVQGNATLNATHNNPRNLAVKEIVTSGGARLIR
jgi:Flp pilus assembly protein TadG